MIPNPTLETAGTFLTRSEFADVFEEFHDKKMEIPEEKDEAIKPLFLSPQLEFDF
jgi:hypothetical protein